jgi:N6-adenosine-specific RNA methylase IME4
MELRIEPRFANLLPPLSANEMATLTESIRTEGCREALAVWNGVLIDGHNRYAICRKLGVEFKTRKVEFASAEAAEDWIDANQLARRNLKPDDFTLALGRRYNRTKRQDGGHGDQKSGGQNVRPNTAFALADEHGVNEKTVRRAGKIAEEVESDPELKKAVAGGKTILQAKRDAKESKREERRQENAKTVSKSSSPVQSGAKFATILLDPPWDWGDEGDVNQMGRAKPDYATMSKEQLMALPVGQLADFDCHLYCWITNRSMPKGFALIDAWGFRFVTILTWPKKSIGLGNYFRGQSEHILFGVKGSQMLKRKDAGTMLPMWERGKGGHSSKPVEIYDFIESCSPGPYLEMFSRVERKGWTTWGEKSK